MGVASRGSTEAIGYCFPIIGLVVVIARYASRWHAGARLQLDDFLCIPAWLFVTGACTTLLVGLYHGAFFTPDAGTEEQSIERQGHILAQILASFVVLYTFANATIKLSILFFYRRIFVGRIFNVCSWVLIGASVVWFIYGILAWILYCGTQVRANFEGPFTVCPLWGVDVEMAVFVFDSVIDFGILILPIPLVWNLQISLGRKILVLCLFLIGGLALVASVNNTVVQLIYVVDPMNNGVEGANPDFLQGGDLILSNWPAIEIGVGLIACCLPSISMAAIRAVSGWVLQGWRSISDTVSQLRTSRNASVQNVSRTEEHSPSRGGESSNHSNSRMGDIHLSNLSKTKSESHQVHVTDDESGKSV